MKILIFEPKFLTPKHYSFSPLVFVKSAARAFAKQGDEVFVLSQGLDKVEQRDGYTIYPLGGDIVPLRRFFPNELESLPNVFPGFSVGVVARATKIIRQQIRPDVIYTCGTVFPAAVSAMLQRNTGVPTVHHVFFRPSQRWWWSALIEGYHTPRFYAARNAAKNLLHEMAKPNLVAGWGLRHLAKVMASSVYLRKRLVRFGLEESDIPVVYPGVDIPPPLAPPPRKEGLTVLYMGHLWQGRGVLDLAEAFGTVVERFPQCKLVIAPTDINALSRNYFLGIIEKYGMGANIEWRGIVNDVNADLLAPADVIVLPYRNDASIKLVETMAAGKAIVTTTIDWIPEIITDGVNGCLVPPANPAALAAGLEKVLADAQLRQRLGANARETAIQKCGLDVAAREIRGVFQSVLGGGVYGA